MVTEEQRQIAHRYGRGEAVRDLAYELQTNSTAVYSLITAVAQDEGVDLKQQHRQHRDQARAARDLVIRQRYRDGMALGVIIQQTGLDEHEIRQAMARADRAIARQADKERHADVEREQQKHRADELRRSAEDLLIESPDASIKQLYELSRGPEDDAVLNAIWKTHRPVRQQRRAQRFVQQYLEGMTLAEIGQEHDISRERVRQVISAYYPGGFGLAMQARQVRSQANTGKRRAQTLARTHRWLQGRSAVTVAELDAAIKPYKEDTSWLHAQVHDRLVRGRSLGAVYSDEQLIEVIIAAAALTEGVLTSGRYEELRQPGWPSLALIVHRMGWNEALRRAGITAQPSRRSYQRRWDATSAVEWVHRFRQEVPGGSSLVYASWQQRHDSAPSLATVTLLLGGWRQAVQQALS